MSLTHPFARSPFGTRSGGQFDFSPPEHVRYWEPWPRRMRAVLAGETVLDSRRGILLWETGNFPAYYYPLEDIRPDLLDGSTSEDGQDRPKRWSVRRLTRLVVTSVSATPSPSVSTTPVVSVDRDTRRIE